MLGRWLYYTALESLPIIAAEVKSLSCCGGLGYLTEIRHFHSLHLLFQIWTWKMIRLATKILSSEMRRRYSLHHILKWYNLSASRFAEICTWLVLLRQDVQVGLSRQWKIPRKFGNFKKSFVDSETSIVWKSLKLRRGATINTRSYLSENLKIELQLSLSHFNFHSLSSSSIQNDNNNSTHFHISKYLTFKSHLILFD